MNDRDTAKVLKREITPEIWKSRIKDTEEVLDNYRENLRDHGVTEEGLIERFVAQEREKIYKEFESLDRGDIFSNTYYPSDNWESIAEKMKEQEIEEGFEISM